MFATMGTTVAIAFQRREARAADRIVGAQLKIGAGRTL
jgi:hypothetical protein